MKVSLVCLWIGSTFLETLKLDLNTHEIEPKFKFKLFVYILQYEIAVMTDNLYLLFSVCGSGNPISFTTHGTLSSPGSPGRYPNNRDCFWTLVAPLNRRIQFHFYTMQIEASANCSNDYLEVCILSFTI